MYVGILKKVGVAALIAIAVLVAIELLFPFALPFVLAWVVAACLQPAVRLTSRRLGVNRRPMAAIFVTLAVAGLGALTFILVSRFISELGGFLAVLTENAENGLSGAWDKLRAFCERIPFLSYVGDGLSDTVEAALRSMLSEITSAIPTVVGRVLGALPGFFILTVIIIMSSYYFAADFDAIRDKVYRLLPENAKRRWDIFKSRLMGAGAQYLKACLALAFITFAELLVGFLVLRIPYAFTLAIVIALVDMLPILGAGTVLIPWAIFEWATGNGYYAVGLFIIFAGVSVVRRFSEPRVIGSGIGLSPITTLVSMYIGFRAYGLGGLFLAPLFAVLILSALPDNISETFGMSVQNGREDSKINKKRKYTGVAP